MIRRPRTNAVPVHLTGAQRRRVEELAKKGEASVRVLKRARILILLADGWAPSDVPAAVGCGEATVRRTRQRFHAGGLDTALYERPRPGREPALDDKSRARIVAMVCGPPPDGRARWTVRLVAREAIARGIVDDVGRESIRITLRDHDLKPWREKNVVRSKTR